MQLTYDEITDILEKKYSQSRRRGYNLPPGINEISDISEALEFYYLFL